MQMSRSPASSARSASTTPDSSAKVCPKTSRPQPMSRTTSESMPRSWCWEGCFHERLVIAGADATAVRRRWPATRGVPVTASHPVVLQPELEQAQLPQLVPLERGQLAVGVGQQLLDVLRAEQAALAGGVRGEGVAHQIEHLAL